MIRVIHHVKLHYNTTTQKMKRTATSSDIKTIFYQFSVFICRIQLCRYPEAQSVHSFVSHDGQGILNAPSPCFTYGDLVPSRISIFLFPRLDDTYCSFSTLWYGRDEVVSSICDTHWPFIPVPVVLHFHCFLTRTWAHPIFGPWSYRPTWYPGI